MVSHKEEHIRNLLRKAKQVKEPLAELLPPVKSYNASGQLPQVRAYHARDMPKGLQEWCLEVCRDNMAAMYNKVWTWSDSSKRKQLTSVASRFLVAHEPAGNHAPLAYMNYRFEQEEGEPVLYCYELQVHRSAQGRGLGRLLMELAEQIAWATGMSKAMLTVFTENVPAVAFYRKLGYQLDETSPDYCDEGDSNCAQTSAGTVSISQGSGSGTQPAGCGYHIMSKRAPAAAKMATSADGQAGTEPCLRAGAVAAEKDAAGSGPKAMLEAVQGAGGAMSQPSGVSNEARATLQDAGEGAGVPAPQPQLDAMGQTYVSTCKAGKQPVKRARTESSGPSHGPLLGQNVCGNAPGLGYTADLEGKALGAQLELP